jgi:hypothetical protein
VYTALRNGVQSFFPSYAEWTPKNMSLKRLSFEVSFKGVVYMASRLILGIASFSLEDLLQMEIGLFHTTIRLM